MFENIGGKIKVLATVTTIVGMAAFVIWGLVFLFSGAPFLGLLTAGLGCLGAWISSFLLYGFGQLIEQQEYSTRISIEILKKLNQRTKSDHTPDDSKSGASSEDSGYSLSQMAEQRTKNTMKGSDFWVCKSCKTKNDAFNLYCKNCGQFK